MEFEKVELVKYSNHPKINRWLVFKQRKTVIIHICGTPTKSCQSRIVSCRFTADSENNICMIITHFYKSCK